MGAHHIGDDDRREDGGENAATAAEPTSSARAVNWREVLDLISRVLSGIVRWAGLACASVLVLHVLFVVGEGNPDNGIVEFVGGTAEAVSLGFEDLFLPDDPKLAVLVNYGLAALFWLVVTSVGANALRRIGRGNP
ncbi:hypothetical protein [Saccharomonospora piscinae]|uniref:hypothetical protein n=1 Tax=Saccharomonospora piscinae TaxID=687388 RepID=UPI00046423F0|nr:hypothetical protein [Saccharomonospora piscinae]